MPKTKVNSLDLYYESEGSGPPVVFVGGMTQDHLGWAFQVPAVAAAGYRCVTFDARDTGQSSESPAPYDVRQLAGDTLGLMDVLEIPSAHIVGLSMGGMAAQEMAIRAPQRVSSLTLVATLASVDPETAGVLRAWRASRPHCDDLDFVLMVSPWLLTHRFYQQPETVAGFLQLVRGNPFPQTVAGFQRQSDAVMSHDARGRISQIQAPTHVIVGAEDVLSPPRHSRWLAGQIAGAKLTEIAAAAHLVTLERPDEFNRVLLEFLQAHSKAA